MLNDQSILGRPLETGVTGVTWVTPQESVGLVLPGPGNGGEHIGRMTLEDPTPLEADPTPRLSPNACASCCSWRPIPDRRGVETPNTGHCKRSAPVVMEALLEHELALPTGMDLHSAIAWATRFPITTGADGCGKWDASQPYLAEAERRRRAENEERYRLAEEERVCAAVPFHRDLDDDVAF